MTTFHRNHCEQSEVTCAYAAQVLPESEVAAAEAHIASCPDCQRELESLRAVVGRFVSWPTDVLRPPTSLQGRLALRIAEETGKQPVPPPARQWSEPEWEQVAPGIECKLLAADTERHRVSMLVRLAPGASYPAHTHAGKKSCISSTVSCGSTGASSSRATTTTVRLERSTSASGARPVAPASSSPAPKIPFAEAHRTHNAPTRRPPVLAVVGVYGHAWQVLSSPLRSIPPSSGWGHSFRHFGTNPKAHV
jgi:anti-sigma factor RsiW